MADYSNVVANALSKLSPLMNSEVAQHLTPEDRTSLLLASIPDDDDGGVGKAPVRDIWAPVFREKDAQWLNQREWSMRMFEGRPRAFLSFYDHLPDIMYETLGQTFDVGIVMDNVMYEWLDRCVRRPSTADMRFTMHRMRPEFCWCLRQTRPGSKVINLVVLISAALNALNLRLHPPTSMEMLRLLVEHNRDPANRAGVTTSDINFLGAELGKYVTCMTHHDTLLGVECTSVVELVRSVMLADGHVKSMTIPPTLFDHLRTLANASPHDDKQLAYLMYVFPLTFVKGRAFDLSTTAKDAPRVAESIRDHFTELEKRIRHTVTPVVREREIRSTPATELNKRPRLF